jgi:alanine racemase
MPTRPCWVEIRTQSLEEDYRFLASLSAPHAELLAIVKADAYGHSLAHCAPAAVRAGARWLGVTSVEEGATARALCPDAHILVIGGVFRKQASAIAQHKLTTVAWEAWQLEELSAAARASQTSLPVHLEIDTGMSRQGVSPNAEFAALAPLLRYFSPSSPLRLEAVMTHLYAADEADGRGTKAQLAQLDAVLTRIHEAGMNPDWLNVGNSAALLAGQAPAIADLAARHGMKAMLRPGLALYGLAPQFEPPFEDREPDTFVAARAALKPVLSWKSAVVGVRSVPTGAVVGYNGTFVATEPMRLALVAAGYGDGLDRHLSNSFSLLVCGQRAPIVGRISMDQTVLDVTEIPDVEPGDEVVIVGTQGSETITAFDHAAVSGTIPWEVFTRINARVRRIAV